MTLHAEARGEGDATVVFLHGFGGVGGTWGRVADAVAGDARILVYDMPGHGRSLSVQDGKAGRLAILADLNARGTGVLHLVGHSMGGAIAVILALAAPGRFASLTLLAPGGFGPEINGAALARSARACGRDEIRLSHSALAAPGHVTPEAVIEALVTARAIPGQTERLVALAAAISADNRQGVLAREKLATLDMPVKVLWGAADPVLPYGQTVGLPPLFALHSFEGAGHMLAEERPDAVIALIRQNLRAPGDRLTFR